jgi:GTP-binding protein HflX
VRRLPHHLVEAFHSTLGKRRRDLILNVCDAASEQIEDQTLSRPTAE